MFVSTTISRSSSRQSPMSAHEVAEHRSRPVHRLYNCRPRSSLSMPKADDSLLYTHGARHRVIQVVALSTVERALVQSMDRALASRKSRARSESRRARFCLFDVSAFVDSAESHTHQGFEHATTPAGRRERQTYQK